MIVWLCTTYDWLWRGALTNQEGGGGEWGGIVDGTVEAQKGASPPPHTHTHTHTCTHTHTPQ